MYNSSKTNTHIFAYFGYPMMGNFKFCLFPPSMSYYMTLEPPLFLFFALNIVSILSYKGMPVLYYSIGELYIKISFSLLSPSNS